MLRGLLIAAAAVFVVWILAIGVLVVTGRRTQARELAAFLPNLLLLFRGLLKDPRVPPGSKVYLPEDQARARVDAALAAGGRIANEANAPGWWTLADPEGNEVDVAPWPDAGLG